MNKSMMTGIGIGVAIAAAVGAVAGYRATRGPQFADVISSAPVTTTEKVAREDCRDEAVERQKAVKDEKRIAGTALGAVVGGVLGNQIGDGSGQTLATVAGAAAGGYAGNRIQKRMQEGNTETVTERRCTTVYDSRERIVGYDVTYRLDGQTGTLRMDEAPAVGARLPVQDGKVVPPGAPAAPGEAASGPT